MSRKKYENAMLSQIIMKYKHLTADDLSSSIAAFVGGGNESRSSVEKRAKMLYEGASKSNKVEVSSERLFEFLQECGISGRHRAEICNLFETFDHDGNGSLDIDEFISMIWAVMDNEKMLTGMETLETITGPQVEKLCRMNWSLLFDEDLDTFTGGAFKRNLIKKLRDAAGNDLPERSYSSGHQPSLKSSNSILWSKRTRSTNSREQHSSGETERITESRETWRLSRKEEGLTSGRSACRFNNSGQSLSIVSAESAAVGAAESSAYACPLPPSSSKRAKLAWVLNLGKILIMKGKISLPAVSWNGETEQEQNAIDRLGFASLTSKPSLLASLILSCKAQALPASRFLFETYKVQYWFSKLQNLGNLSTLNLT